jgi:hypothetical protein
LKGLAAIVNSAAESTGSLKNAFDTCFFEGLRRGGSKSLKPFLSQTAKKKWWPKLLVNVRFGRYETIQVCMRRQGAISGRVPRECRSDRFWP